MLERKTKAGIRDLLLTCLLSWATIVCGADWKSPRENLEHRVIVGDIRIYYTLAGEHAFPVDQRFQQNKARTHAMLDQLAKQFEEAQRVYTDLLQLVPPLQNKRYRNVDFIDVHLLHLAQGMGSTGDGIVRYRYRHFEGTGSAITITLSTRWRPPNSTPNHELFHAYQYGYTFFKNPWFLEGLARSMDNAFANRFPVEPLPRDLPELEAIMARSYRANLFWNRVMQLCDPTCKAGTASTTPPQICGGSIVRPLLEQYQSLDRLAAKDRGIDPDNWPESEQRSDKNNPYLLLGLQRVLEAHCPLSSTPELNRLHQLVDLRP